MRLPKVKVESANRHFMLAAIKEQKKCTTDTKVGAVAVVNGKIVAIAHKAGDTLEKHAEQLLLKKLKERKINKSDCDVYVTMEPCSGDNSCSYKLRNAKVRKVVIGCYDLNPAHYRKGWTALRDKKIPLQDFDQDLRNKYLNFNLVRMICGRLAFGAHLTPIRKFSFSVFRELHQMQWEQKISVKLMTPQHLI